MQQHVKKLDQSIFHILTAALGILVVLLCLGAYSALSGRLEINWVLAGLFSTLVLLSLLFMWGWICGVRGNERDAAEVLQCREEKVKYLSLYNPLTGLMNRSALRQWVNRAKTGHQAREQSVISLDIDNFRVINDSLGHTAGDRLLVDLASKMEACVAGRGEVYHTSGDEFVFLISTTNEDIIHDLAKELHRSVSGQVSIEQRTFFLTASIGVSIGDGHLTGDEVLQQADTALYVAKKNTNRIAFYTPDMDQTRSRENILGNDMRHALEQDQFVLHYQPILAVKQGAVKRAEALIRWNHPQFGRISPDEFIPIAEKNKLIIPISEWVIRHACTQVAEWQAAGLANMVVCVNLSLVYFEKRACHLADYVKDVIQLTGIRPSDLELEITETVLMSDPDDTIGILQSLHDHGVRLAMDDFGTGYTSFQYLRDMPLQTIKLDRSMISAIDESDKGRMIVKAMVDIVHGLNLEIVAEGVETVEQFRYLKECECDYVQGYHFSRPLPGDEFAVYYRDMQKPG